MPRIVVLGGTFNPMSKAHGSVLQESRRAVGADKALLLPAPDAFLHSWKRFDDKQILPLRTRLRILERYCQRHRDTFVEYIEVDKKSRYTYDSLQLLKEKYRTAELYFVVGSEKAAEMDRWHEGERLLAENKFVLCRRNDDDLEALLAIEAIARNRRNFHFLRLGEETQNISSTRIRKAIAEKDRTTIRDLTYSYVVDILKEDGIL